MGEGRAGQYMGERVLDAELSEEESDVLDAVLDIDNADARRERRQLNSAFGATIAFVIVAMLVSNIFSPPLKNEIDDNNSNSYPPIWERYLEDFTTDDVHSYILQNGTLTGPDGANMWSGMHHFVEFFI